METNNLLAGKGLLTPIQKAFLAIFKMIPDQEQFYLTGGTALTEYYFGHRLSYDLDFFTGIDGLVQPFSNQIERYAEKQHLKLEVVRRFTSYVEFTARLDDETLKVDIALDSPFRFFPPLLSSVGVYVNNYQDICVDKLLAYYGRAEPRDAVDLFCILERNPLEDLLLQAAQKDPGFDLYWFAVALNRSQFFPDEPERWPVKMLIDWNPKDIKAKFKALSQKVVSDIGRSE